MVHKHDGAKQGISSIGKSMHYSVGAIIQKNKKFLLIDRAAPPYGFAGLGGHIDEQESPEQAIKREVQEESNLKVKNCTLLYEEEVSNNKCVEGIDVHHWYVFACTAKGKTRRDEHETKSMGWYSKEDIKKLRLEPVWEHWFRKLKVI